MNLFHKEKKNFLVFCDFYLIRASSKKLIERVEVVVTGLLRDDSRLFQQVVVDVTAHRVALNQSNSFENVKFKSRL
jgi:hypothetical protein